MTDQRDYVYLDQQGKLTPIEVIWEPPVEASKITPWWQVLLVSALAGLLCAMLTAAALARYGWPA